MTTKELEKIIYKRLSKLGTYLCFEVAMPVDFKGKYMNRERVDLLSYETQKNCWRFYELKVSLNDFNSKCHKSFYGHFNYYVMPNELYDKVKNLIPSDIGVYTEYGCIKKAKKKELQIKHNDLMFAFMQALYREYHKQKRLT